jgi:hypothetical protein
MSIYNPNIPQPTDELSDSQGQILQNFQKADSSFGTDHYRFSDLTVNNGFHQRATFPGNAPAPTPAANYGAIYAITNGSSETWPYWRRDGGTADLPAIPIRLFGEFTTNPVVLRPNGFGITGITFIALGRYRVDFTTAFPDTNYKVLAQMELGTPPLAALCVLAYGQKLTTSCEIQFWRQDGTGFSNLLPTVSIAVLRNG